MSAVVCGKRSSIFEEQLPSSTSPPVSSKRIRFSSSSSPVRFATTSFAAPSSYSSLFDQLRAFFPEMESQLLEKALEECGDDLDSAIRSLNELRLSSAAKAAVSSEANAQAQAQGPVAANGEGSSNDDLSGQNNLPTQGADWVELFVREMMSASNMDDAKARASRVLEVLEKSICSHASTEAAQSFHQENMMLKEQMEALIQENTILKRAVSTQHERQKEYEDRGQELQHLKQLVAQYQEQLRTLEVNNYALTMHLKQAQQSSSIPGRFHPDIF